MMDELYTNNELPISATEGWKQMQFLLDEKLPQKKNAGIFSTARSVFSVIFICSIFMLSSIQLSDSTVQLNLNTDIAAVKKNNDPQESSYATILIAKQNNSSSPVGVNLPTHDKPAFFVSKPVDDDFKLNERVNGLFAVNVFKENGKVPALPLITRSVFNNEITGERLKVKEKNQSPGWHFAAGAGVNIVEGRQQNYQPFPAVEVSYNLNSKFYLSTGLSAFAPVASDISGITKTVYINDTVNDISMYKEVAKFSQLRYANIPLMAGVQVSNKFSVQAGMQLSVLISKKKTIEQRPYDFQMNDVSPATIPPVAGLAAPQQDAIVKPRSVNYQFTAGIKYTMNKTSFGLTYQQALQSTGIGNTNANAGKRLFTFNVLYNLK